MSEGFSETKISSVKIKKSGPQVDEHVDLVVVPPDGGWGWAVVAAAFICNVITDGTTYSFGLFTDEISKELKVSSVKISLASSFSTGIGYMSGPLVCAILNRYGFRFCGFLGGLLSTIILITASFLRSLVPFLIVFGFMCGFSFCMVYVPAVLVVGFYFDRWRALAVSLQSSGSSTGMIIFAPIFKCLLYNLSWRWKFRILAAGCSLAGVLALTYLPLKPLRTFHNKVPLADGAISEELIDIGDSVSSLDFIKKYQNVAYSATGDDKTVISYDSKQYTSNMSFSSSKSGGSYSKQTGKHVSKAALDTVLEEGCSGSEMGYCRKMQIYCLKRICPCCYSKKSVKNISRPMYRNDIFYHGSISRLSLFKLTISAGSVPSNKPTVDYHMSVSRVVTQKDVEEERSHCILCPEAMKRTLATMLDFSLMRSPSFMVILFSGFFTTVGMYVPFIYIKQYAVQKGMNDDTANFLLSALGVSNLLGRVICGIASSVPAIGAWKFSTGCLLVCGIITLFTPYYVNTVVQFIYATFFGFTVAALPSLRSVMLVDMLGVERLTNAFGLVMLFQGFACFGGVPIANLLKDQTGSYDAVFIFCGSTILLSAIMLLPINWVANRERLNDSRAPADALKKGSSVFGGKVKLGDETTTPAKTGAGGPNQEASGSKQIGGSKK